MARHADADPQPQSERNHACVHATIIFQLYHIIFVQPLITGTVLKGLTGRIFMTPPLTLTPRGLEKTPLISEEEILRRNAERGFISAAVCTRRGHVSGFI